MRTVCGQLLLRRVLFEKFGILPDRLKLDFGPPRAKPFLPEQPDCHFNLAHSGEWVVCAVSAAPVGVDIEEIRPLDLAVAETVFAPGELARFKALDAPRPA